MRKAENIACANKNDTLLELCYTNLARVAESKGKQSEAVGLARKAVGLEKKIAPDSLNMADMRSYLSTLFEDNNQLAEATVERTNAIKIYSRMAPTRVDPKKNKKASEFSV